jgi:hypothetical protein
VTASVRQRGPGGAPGGGRSRQPKVTTTARTRLGIDYFGTRWQYTDVLDWPGSTARYWRGHSTSRIPLVQNLLRNHEYRRYYLHYLEHLLENEFSPPAGQHAAATQPAEEDDAARRRW